MIKADYLKQVNKVVTNTIDSETGELLDVQVKQQQILVTTPKEYFSTFGKIIGVLHELSGADIKVITYLMLNAPINSNYICLGKEYKKKMAEDIGIKFNTVNQSLTNLNSKKVLLRDGKSCYHINPDYYWKGDMNGRNKAMTYLLEMKYLP